MPKQIFHLQQFSVQQQHSAMKVCTDSLLFGAMMPLKQQDKVLDIGTGTGLLSLMAAQLGASQVTGVELTQSAYQEAAMNFKQSRWSGRLEASHCDIQRFAMTCDSRYDLIISNPPFFTNHGKGFDALRNTARHNDTLSFADLIKSVDELLTDDGLFYVLLPVHALEKFVLEAKVLGFWLCAQTDFKGFSHLPSKVLALTFSRQRLAFDHKSVTIYLSHRVYTEIAETHLSVFLLRFQKAL